MRVLSHSETAKQSRSERSAIWRWTDRDRMRFRASKSGRSYLKRSRREALMTIFAAEAMISGGRTSRVAMYSRSWS